MKKRKNMTVFFLALALAVNMLFAGNIVVKADTENELTQPKVTSVTVRPANPAAQGIYPGDPIEIEVGYELQEGYSVYGVALYFAEESVNIDDEDADVEVYSYYSEEGLVEENPLIISGSLYAPNSIGTKVLKRIDFYSVNVYDEPSDCTYLYVEEGEQKGKLQPLDDNFNPIEDYIDGCSMTVEERYSDLKIASLELDSEKTGENQRMYLNIGLTNYSPNEITVPAYNSENGTGIKVSYNYTPSDETEVESSVDFYSTEPITITAGKTKVVSIPMTPTKKGTYELNTLDIVVNDSLYLYYWMDYGDILVAYNDEGDVIQSINMSNNSLNFTVSDSGEIETPDEPDNPDEPEELTGVVLVESVQFVAEDGIPVSGSNLTLEAGQASQIKAVLCVKNDTNKEYQFDSESSYILWSIPHENIPYSEIKGTFDSMKSEDDQDIYAIPAGQTVYIYYNLDIDEDIIPGKAELSEIYLVGNAVDSDIELRTYYYKYDDEGDGLEGYIEIGNEDSMVLDSLACGSTLDFFVENSNADLAAPIITNLSKITEEPIYTGTEIAFSVSYSDDKSNVEYITMTFEGKDGTTLIGEAYTLSGEGDFAEFAQSATDETIYVSFDSGYRTIIGDFVLKSVEIMDSWGNTRVYSDEKPEGKQTVTFTTASNSEQGADILAKIASVSEEDENVTTWSDWKASCGFERVAYTDGVQITSVTLDADLNKNEVVPGTPFNANVTVKNDSGTDFVVGYSKICWEGPVDEDDCPTEICASQQKQFTIPAGQSGIISIPVQLEKDEINGKRILSEIYLAKSYEGEDVFETASEGELFTNGVYYCFYGGNLIGTFNPDADFIIKTPAVTPPAVTPSKPAPTTPAVTSTPTTNTQPAAPAEVINRKLKGTKIISLKAAKKKVVVKWKKQTKKIKGYQLQYSTDKKFKTGVKTKTINGNKKTSVTLKGLKSKKTYYVRIRTWQKTSTGKAYSTWSKAKKVKVK